MGGRTKRRDIVFRENRGDRSQFVFLVGVMVRFFLVLRELEGKVFRNGELFFKGHRNWL